MLSRTSTLLALFFCTSAGLNAQTEVIISDSDLAANNTYNWTNDNVYLLDGLVYLETGGVLNIEAGTAIKGKGNPTTGDNASALIIARGAQIFANGTADAPVIFTAEEDFLDDPGDFTPQDRGEWGGLIILGSATIARPGGEDGVEGIDADEDRARYGGTQDDDNSGRLNYVSIRHGGSALSPNNEINGLTLGGVGSGTEIDYIEVMANFDDGIEFFGGTVGVKHAVVSACGDDAFDYDYGYRGKGQYWFSLQLPDFGPTGRAGEHDGAKPDDQAPFSQPTIFNATYIGIGASANASGGDAADGLAFGIMLRDNTGGFYNNSIFTDFNGAAIAIEDRTDTDDGDAYARFAAGDLAFNNNFFFGFGEGSTAEDLFLAVDTDEANIPAVTSSVALTFTNNGNQISDPQLQQITDRSMLDPRPMPGSPASSGAPAATDNFFDPVAYYGAFSPGNGDQNPSWLEGWTAVSEYNLVELTLATSRVVQAGFELGLPAPNPAQHQTTIAVEFPRASEANLVITDIFGRSVQQVLTNSLLSAGTTQITVNTSRLVSGNYMIILQTEGVRLAQKLVINQ